MNKFNAEVIYSQKEVTTEELKIERTLANKINLKLIWGLTLYHIDGLPFRPEKTHKHFTLFRQKIERHSQVRELFDSPTGIRTPEISLTEMPDFKVFGHEPPERDNRESFIFKGGEDEGLKCLHFYLFEEKHIANYKKNPKWING